MNRKHQPPYPAGAVDTRLDTYLTLGHDVGFILVHGKLELTQQISPIQTYPTTHTYTHNGQMYGVPPPQTHTHNMSRISGPSTRQNPEFGPSKE